MPLCLRAVSLRGLGAKGVGYGLDAAVRGEAAVHGDVRPGDERRIVGHQEDDERRDFVDGPGAAQGVSRMLDARKAGVAEAVISVSM